VLRSEILSTAGQLNQKTVFKTWFHVQLLHAIILAPVDHWSLKNCTQHTAHETTALKRSKKATDLEGYSRSTSSDKYRPHTFCELIQCAFFHGWELEMFQIAWVPSRSLNVIDNGAICISVNCLVHFTRHYKTFYVNRKGSISQYDWAIMTCFSLSTVRMLYGFKDMMSYWSKILMFSYCTAWVLGAMVKTDPTVFSSRSLYLSSRLHDKHQPYSDTILVCKGWTDTQDHSFILC